MTPQALPSLDGTSMDVLAAGKLHENIVPNSRNWTISVENL